MQILGMWEGGKVLCLSYVVRYAPRLMKHLTVNEGHIRVLDWYTITMGCVLDLVTGVLAS